MAPDLASLPDDVETLRAIVAAQAAELAAKDGLIGSLRLQLARLRRQQFGRSSERLECDIAHLPLPLEQLEAGQAATALAAPEDGCEDQVAPGAAKPARRPLGSRSAAGVEGGRTTGARLRPSHPTSTRSAHSCSMWRR